MPWRSAAYWLALPAHAQPAFFYNTGEERVEEGKERKKGKKVVEFRGDRSNFM